jgi:Na+/proline symporter
LVTAVEPVASVDIAAALAWPNPFRGSVSMAFSLAAATPVRMEVVDVAGRYVWGARSEFLPAGLLSLAWSGETDTGAAASAGIHFLRVTGPGIALS